MNRKKTFFLSVITIMLFFAGLFLYSYTSSKYTVKNVSNKETFRIPSSGKENALNMNMQLEGYVSSKFKLEVTEASSNAVLFDSSFSQGNINYFCKIDLYSNRGVIIRYVPYGVKDGHLTITAVINSSI